MKVETGRACLHGKGCLPFTCVKPVGSRFGLMKNKIQDWYKFGTRIRAFTICTNQFHLPKNVRESLKLGLKIALMK